MDALLISIVVLCSLARVSGKRSVGDQFNFIRLVKRFTKTMKISVGEKKIEKKTLLRNVHAESCKYRGQIVLAVITY